MTPPCLDLYLLLSCSLFPSPAICLFGKRTKSQKSLPWSVCQQNEQKDKVDLLSKKCAGFNNSTFNQEVTTNSKHIPLLAETDGSSVVVLLGSLF